MKFLLKLSLLILIYQNCSRTQFSVDKIQPSLACSDSQLQCETAVGYGTQTCNETVSGMQLGACVLSSCKPGFIFDEQALGCVAQSCNAGETQECPVDNGTGVRNCVAGFYSTQCQLSCDPGYHPHPITQNCSAEFLIVNQQNILELFLYPSPNPNQFLELNIEHSSNLQITEDVSSLQRVHGECLQLAESATLSPFIDGPNSQGLYQLGVNRWSYTVERMRQMTGCVWRTQVRARNTENSQVRNAVVILTPLCSVGDVNSATSCPQGMQSLCVDLNADGYGEEYRCESVAQSCPENWQYSQANQRCEQTPCQGILQVQNNELRCTCPGGGVASYQQSAWRCPSP